MMVGFYRAFASQASAAVQRITYEQIDGGTPARVLDAMVPVSLQPFLTGSGAEFFVSV